MLEAAKDQSRRDQLMLIEAACLDALLPKKNYRNLIRNLQQKFCMNKISNFIELKQGLFICVKHRADGKCWIYLIKPLVVHQWLEL